MDVFNETIADVTGSNPGFHVGHLPNLAVHYLSNYLEARDLRAVPINFFNVQKEELAQLILAGAPAVAITTTFYVDAAPIREIIDFIRKISSKTTIVVGGPHIFNVCSNYDVDTQDYLFEQIGADVYIFDSQGERTLSDVLISFRNGDPLDNIPNLIFCSGGKMSRTHREIEDNSLDENVVRWRRFEADAYVPTVQMRTARSCAFKCSFCRYPVVAGNLTLTNLEVVEQEVRDLVAQGVNQIVFIDDTFNVPLRRFKDFCRMMIKNRFDVSWFSYFRCANADEEAFDLLQESRCAGVFLGVESADQGVLQNMNKSATPDRYLRGITALKKRNIITFVSLIIGFPGETAESVENTFKFLQETSPTFFRAELYYHDEHIPIQTRAKEFGLKGAGYSWRHNTMNWAQACDHIDGLYRRVTNSTILPLYMFDFWSLPYLIGRGISLDEVTLFLKTVRPALDGRERMDPPGEVELEAALAAAFAGGFRSVNPELPRAAVHRELVPLR
jgi:p-methyltransferase